MYTLKWGNRQFLGSFEVEEGKPGWFSLNHFALSCHGTHFIKQTSWGNGVRCIRWSVTQIHLSLSRSLTRSLYFSHWQSVSDRCRSVWWDDWLLGHIYFPFTLHLLLALFICSSDSYVAVLEPNTYILSFIHCSKKLNEHFLIRE